MDFVTFEIANKLKEKGFKEKCVAYYWEKINEHTPAFVVEDNIPEDGICLLDLLSNHNQAEWSCFIDAPTISQVLKWLREEKKLHIEPCVLADSDTDADNKIINEYTYWSFSIISIETGDMIYFEYEHIDDKRFDTYEQAVLAGIEYVLDNLI